MRHARISLAALKRSAAHRPPGYVADVIGQAESVTDGHAILTARVYKELVAKYRPVSGPGTELKALLKTIGIEATPNCSCNKRARIMDEKGCDWCEANIEEISGWMAEEAKKRNLPFIPLVGRTLVKIAVRRARKKGNSQ